MKYEVVIGIEIHAELKSKNKLFSPAPNTYGADVNARTNFYDTAQPGTLPQLNKECVELALLASLALNCKITKYMEFDRKNYFYPDIAKGYQITQDRTPIGRDGFVNFEIDGEAKCVNITRVHIEEDTAKSIHLGEDTLLDFNRSGSPLIEIVSDASMRSPKEASKYLEVLRGILLFSGVSDVRMEEGSMRCDANISIREFGEKLGTKVEIKNLNSISKVEKSLMYEIERQTDVIESGGTIFQETRRFNDLTGETVVMRVKESADDYRYHHDPNIPPIILEDTYIEAVRNKLPELPKQKITRYIEDYKLSDYDANVLVSTVEISAMFEESVSLKANPKILANLIMGDISAYLNKNKVELIETKLTAQNLVDIANVFEKDIISSKIVKNVLAYAIENNIDVNEYIKKEGLIQISDDNELEKIIDEVVLQNEKSVNDYLSGNEYAFKYLIGQVMKLSKGKANPKKATKIIKEKIQK
ncbi:MAG: Asp-tRNA(Asn)/Glu-tRNA(Gln) amidotransferase subunit GatB [Bacilli bacterium]